MLKLSSDVNTQVLSGSDSINLVRLHSGRVPTWQQGIPTAFINVVTQASAFDARLNSQSGSVMTLVKFFNDFLHSKNFCLRKEVCALDDKFCSVESFNITSIQ